VVTLSTLMENISDASGPFTAS